MIVNNACADVTDLYMCACGCTACAKIANCAGEITCSSSSNQKCTKCKDGYFLSRNKKACQNGSMCACVCCIYLGIHGVFSSVTLDV